MKNSMKQIFRMPLKAGLFCIIFIFGTMLFTVGLNLWLELSEKIKAADEVFSTVCMVRQKEQSTILEEQWDAGLKKFIYQEKKVYGDFLTTDILENLAIDYVSGPQQRPYFGASSPEMRVGVENVDEMVGILSLVEINALEDCVPDEPVRVEVVRVLSGMQSLMGKTIDFCDHRTKQPESLVAGKTYIAYIGMNPVNVEKHEGFTGLLEYIPLKIYKNQTKNWYEVTEDFYQTEEGIRWENIARMLNTCHKKMLPVTPVSDLQLLRPFHDGDAVLAEGREIEQLEYENGAEVCLIPVEFAKLNGLQVGDNLPLQFYFADYNNPVCQVAFLKGGLGAEALDDEGNPLDVFQESIYEIVGTYSYPAVPTNTPDAFAANQIFVPENSITENFEDHISERGPMQIYNTSFRIKNGSVSKFYEEFSSLPESQLLEIEVDDGGYEQFAFRMKNVRIVASVLFVAGFLLLLATIACLMYYMILKQKRRTAIEQALGMNQRQSIVSLLSGIIVLTVICGMTGSILGMKMNHVVQEMANNENDAFSTSYTKGILNESVKAENPLENASGNMWGMICLIVLCETIFVWILALFFIKRNLRAAPIQVLSARDDE